MQELITRYGKLQGVVSPNYYKTGTLSGCLLEAYNEIETVVGTLVPKYYTLESRTKYREAISFWPSGALKSVYLDQPMQLNTVLGTLQAELVTFYEDGKLHRLFPVYGQISGYWTENEEYKLVPVANMDYGNLKLHHKIGSYCFYPSGQLKSLSIWPQEVVVIDTNYGEIEVRLGMAFHENGNIKSVEPYLPVLVHTKIGPILAYNNQAIGIQGDCNSVVLDETGELVSLITAFTTITVMTPDGEVSVFKPKLVRSQLDIEQRDVEPLRIEFDQEQVRIIDWQGNSSTYYIEGTVFEMHCDSLPPMEMCCSDCSSCSSCNSCNVI